MSVPSIPPRPIRSQQANLAPTTTTPRVPPRPNRLLNRSVSPQREAFARSPLHDASFPRMTKEEMSKLRAPPTTESDLPPRPPSVTLPSIGQEGNEYANMDEVSGSPDSEAQTTKAVSGDLPLHAPTASVPSSTAKTRIAGVTRADSSHPVVANITKAQADNLDRSSGNTPQFMNLNTNMNRSTSSIGGRPLSVQETDEIGIPSIGIQVPMYPNAGDVQAPTPGPPNSSGGLVSPPPTSDGQSLRRKASRDVFHAPPGSYGLHGHGILPTDPISRAWYEKHPEALAQEVNGEYGPSIAEDRKEWMLSSDDLNKLVHTTSLPSFGTSENAREGQPDEYVGYLASEEYTQRIAGTSRPQSIHKHRTSSSHSQVGSPLRKISSAGESPAMERTKSGASARPGSVIESDGDDDVYHIDPHSRRASKHYDSFHDLRFAPVAEDDQPILAADEAAKRPQHMLAAVEPEIGRLHQHEEHHSYLPTGARSTERPASRSNSLATPPSYARLQSDHERTGTPLDNVTEYEPLFPDDEKKMEAIKAKEHPNLARHHFPSQDIWEDTPSSLQLSTEIDDEIPADAPKAVPVSSGALFEHPDAEARRIGNSGLVKQRAVDPSVLDRSYPPDQRFKRGVKDEMTARPEGPHRFPSQDIWEDTPDHHQLVTTLDSEHEDAQNEAGLTRTTSKPTVPARPSRLRNSETSSPVDQPTTLKQKPAIPARPSKPKPRTSSEDVPLAKTTSNTSSTTATARSPTDAEAAGLPAAPKQKPAVPTRPGGSKLAGLKAGFMNDLNNRLQIGPKPVKSEEDDPAAQEQVLQEKQPLADARKGRARGPQRRKPGVSPSNSALTASSDAIEASKLAKLVGVVTVWQIGDAGTVDVGEAKDATAENAPASETKTKEEQSSKTEDSKSSETKETATSAAPSSAVAAANTATADTNTAAAGIPEANIPASEAPVVDEGAAVNHQTATISPDVLSKSETEASQPAAEQQANPPDEVPTLADRNSKFPSNSQTGFDSAAANPDATVSSDVGKNEEAGNEVDKENLEGR